MLCTHVLLCQQRIDSGQVYADLLCLAPIQARSAHAQLQATLTCAL